MKKNARKSSVTSYNNTASIPDLPEGLPWPASEQISITTLFKDPERLLPPDQAAELLGVCVGTLSVWRSTGRYSLKFVKTSRKVRYRVRDIQEFLDSRTRTHTD